MGKYLVTGACGGMGSAVVRMLSEAGHTVYALDRVIRETALGDGTEGIGIRYFRVDLTDRQDLERVTEEIRKETDVLDGIVHTAGVYDLNSLIEMPEEDFLRDFNVNLFGTFRVNQTFSGMLKPGSRIVIVSSELAPLHPLPFTGVYAVTKAAVEKYAETLRMEVQLLKIKVAVVRPGAVNTGMLPESERKLDGFVSNTKYYSVNATRFRKIVGKVEAKHVPPEKVALVIRKALTARRPKLTYKVNRNPLLLLLNALPKRLQLFVIRKILE